ncbi:MAG TPA: ROK family protein [Gemmatimonadales bacterium]|jgi:glucokinase|nr:ROK family protein [Gemmatimonadales bacterium]
MRWLIGIDIGGTNLVVGAVRDDGSCVHGLVAEPTGVPDGPDAVIERIVQLARGVITTTRREDPGADILGVGIGSPGPLDRKQGLVIFTPNLRWKNMPLRDRIGDALQLPASLDNDANCAMLGEHWIGAAKGAQNAVCFTIGTGIGGGIVIGGELVHGASDAAAEIGHITIEVNGRRCGCGNDGCLEAYASGPAIARRAVEAIEAGAVSGIPALAGGDLNRITAQTVFEAVAAGDALADELVRDTARYLGVGMANLLNILNPEVVVVCGGVTRAGDHLFTPLRREVARRAFKPAVDACRIVPGALEGRAGVVGAAKAWLDQHA